MLSNEIRGWLLAQMVADAAEVREDAAEVVTDWESSMNDFQRRVIVRVLALMATSEQRGRVREAQLNAITNILRPPCTTRADVAPLFEIRAGSLDEQDKDYLDGIREAFDEFPEEAAGPGLPRYGLLP